LKNKNYHKKEVAVVVKQVEHADEDSDIKL